MQIKLPPLPQVQSAVNTVSGSTQREQNPKEFQKKSSRKLTLVKDNKQEKDSLESNPEEEAIHQQLAPSSEVVQLLDHKPTPAKQRMNDFQKKTVDLPKKNPKGLNRVL